MVSSGLADLDRAAKHALQIHVLLQLFGPDQSRIFSKYEAAGLLCLIRLTEMSFPHITQFIFVFPHSE